MKMLGDNKTSLILTSEPKTQNQMKHIDVMHQHVYGLVENRELVIE